MKITHEEKKHDRYYLSLTKQVSTASKCQRAKYGSIIVSEDGRIISTGYNGKPRGSCNDLICYRKNLPPNSSKENCCLHSEANALMFSSPVDRKKGTMYVSGVPCNDCALLIMQSGISRIVFENKETIEGHKGSSTEEFWNKYNVDIEVCILNG